MAHESLHFVERKYDRQSDRSLGAIDSVEPRHINTEHFLIEEQEDALCLVLPAGRDLPRASQIRQEGLHTALAKSRRSETLSLASPTRWFGTLSRASSGTQLRSHKNEHDR